MIKFTAEAMFSLIGLGEGRAKSRHHDERFEAPNAFARTVRVNRREGSAEWPVFMA